MRFVFLMMLALTGPLTVLGQGSGSENFFRYFGKYYDHGGVLWEGGVQEVTVPEGEVMALHQDEIFYLDRLIINGTIRTNGFHLKIFAREIKWGEKGRIEGFEPGKGLEPDPPVGGPIPPPALLPTAANFKLGLGGGVCVAKKGTDGLRGADGQRGYDARGACTQMTAKKNQCKFKKNGNLPVMPIQVFSMRQSLPKPLSQPRFDGNGQRGGDGSRGQKGQAGGKGQKGGRGYVRCSGPFPSKSSCRGDRSGQGGMAGLPGFGGRGGLPGEGGPPVPVEYRLGFVASSDLADPTVKNSKLKGQEEMEIFSGGKAGKVGDVGDFGDEGMPGDGGDWSQDRSYIRIKLGFKKVRIKICQSTVHTGLPGHVNSQYQPALSQNIRGNQFETKSVLDPSKNLGYEECINDNLNCEKSFQALWSNKETSKAQFLNHTDLSLQRDEVESAFISWHWARQVNYLFYASLFWMKHNNSSDDSDLKEEQIRQFKNELLSQGQDLVITSSSGHRRFKEILSYWKGHFFDQVDNLIEQEGLSSDKIAKLKAAQLIGKRTLAFMKNIETKYSYKKLKSHEFFLQSYLGSLFRHVEDTCRYYDKVYKKNNFENFEKLKSFFEVPACKNIDSLDEFADLKLRNKIKLSTNNIKNYKNVISKYIRYNASEEESVFFKIKNVIDKLRIYFSALPKAEARWAQSARLIINKSDLTAENIDKIYHGTTRNLSKKGYVMGLALPTVIDLNELPQALNALALMPLLEAKVR